MMDVPMDEADIAFQATLVPDGCVPRGFLAIAVYFNPEGQQKFKVYDQFDMDLAEQLGLLDLAKRELVKRVEAEYGDDF